VQLGDVDFDKSLDVWQQDKWNGQFKVQWHFVKVRSPVLIQLHSHLLNVS
jgi:hypothetical protein